MGGNEPIHAPVGKTGFLEVLPKWRPIEQVHDPFMDASQRKKSTRVAIQAHLVTARCEDRKSPWLQSQKAGN